MKVLVLGAGLAGLACAAELVDEGVEVTLLEADRIPGGKAASWKDGDGATVETGLHVWFPHYRHLMDLMKKAGAYDNILWRPTVFTYVLAGGAVGRLRFPDLPAPFHALAALLRFEHLGWRDRLSTVLGVGETVLRGLSYFDRFDDRDFESWHRSRGLRPRAARRLLAPPAAALAFVDPRRVSAKTLLTWFHHVTRNRESARVGFLDGGMHEKMIRPIAAYVRARGGGLRLGARVARIELDGGDPRRPLVTGVELAGGERLSADAYVSAMPVHALCETLSEAALELPYFADLRRFDPAPVISVQLWLDRKITDVSDVILTPECSFAVAADLSNVTPEFRAAGGSMMQVVVAPADRLIELSDRRLVEVVLADLRDRFAAAREARVTKSAVVRTPRSIYRAVPGLDRYRPCQRSPVANLFLAGDYTRHDFNPSMEGAAASGKLAARALLA
jgi:uncharacterized protein with NAD-binding domain and iron-sulfur cluster